VAQAGLTVATNCTPLLRSDMVHVRALVMNAAVAADCEFAAGYVND
jgi:hypothetical protein